MKKSYGENNSTMKHKVAKELKCNGKRGKTKNKKRRIKNNESMKKEKSR